MTRSTFGKPDYQTEAYADVSESFPGDGAWEVVLMTDPDFSCSQYQKKGPLK